MALRYCDRHGEYELKSVEIFGVRLEAGCPGCEAEDMERHNKIAKEAAELMKRDNYMRRGIEPEFMTATLENYKCENQTETAALKACTDLVDRKVQKVLLLGSNGTGKTHLGCAVAKALSGVRVTMYELSARIRQGYNTGRGELEFLDELLQYPVIVIDEIGRTKGSDAELNWLSYLIDKAHTRGIQMLLISNKHQASRLPKERKYEAIEFFLPNDAISRLRQNSVIVEVEGRDRRAAVAAV